MSEFYAKNLEEITNAADEFVQKIIREGKTETVHIFVGDANGNAVLAEGSMITLKNEEK